MTKKQYEDEVERLAPSLRRIAYSIVRNEHDAQDAVPGHSAGKTKSNPYEGNAGNELSTAGRRAG